MENVKLQLNSTQIPHYILRELMPKLSDTELRIILIIADQTYGWHKDSDAISYSQLKTKTGSSNGSIGNALKTLRTKKLIQVLDENENELNTREECRGKVLYYRINATSPKIGDHLSKNRTPKIGDTKDTYTKDISNKLDISQRNADVDRILEEFTDLTGYSKPTDKNPRGWAYLYAKHKDIKTFRPCLKYLLEDKKYDLNKLETVYRKFPVYEAEVLKISPRKFTKEQEENADIFAHRN